MRWTWNGPVLRPWVALALGAVVSGGLTGACGSNETKDSDEVVGSVQEAVTGDPVVLDRDRING